LISGRNTTIEHIGLAGRHGEDEDLSGDKKAMNEIRGTIREG